jgi:TRAP-type C4-dicarboxylate transport system substrate-binding protein
MKLAEIKHGRLAMIAVSGFGLQEYVSKLAVVDETPFFFYPITETLRNMYG